MSAAPLKYEDLAREILEIVELDDIKLKELVERLEWAAIQLELRKYGGARGAAAMAAKSFNMLRTTLIEKISVYKARYGEG